MGKVRHVIIGDESEELEQKKKAEARREAKKAKKAKDSGESVETDTAGETEVQAKQETKEQASETKQPKQKSKKYLDMAKLVDKNKTYDLTTAINLVKTTSYTKFDGTVEAHINLNPQSLNGKTDYRGVVNLPHGTGKKLRVVVADDAVLASLETGKIEFDILVAHPSMMAKLAKFAKILGPKGLMPNPKNGTVSPDPEKRVKELSGGEVNFKTEPNNPIIHLAVGKVSFDEKQLEENIKTLFLAIGKNKISKATLSSTMGPGIKVAVV